ncbi:hypothetical protein NBO_11g0001 [Nosema bombycis CQ1]|uniref:Uncharacterized protein n=1 Tax=Nosema bombycis (strain CQ1 / CVCC 102059) TaxID=578461 RepID=R0KXK0_NOSB1|nr:hypothetical protein NBO_11g0001 [Nosema bombycis CQ1]|eukprot:EOB14927.1 hypothetical protein NBO_11g0001 [Nosema bombycis CQ1]
MKIIIISVAESFFVVLYLITNPRITCIKTDLPPTYEEVTAINPPNYEQATMNTVIQLDMISLKKQTCFEVFKKAYPERSNRIKFVLVLILFIVTVISWIIGLIFGLIFIAMGLISFFIAIVIGLQVK